MKSIDTVVIGAGQAGLALSRCLTERGAEHVVLERGRVAQSWSERWDSLHLFTPARFRFGDSFADVFDDACAVRDIHTCVDALPVNP